MLRYRRSCIRPRRGSRRRDTPSFHGAILLSAVPTRSHSPPKRANAIVAVVRVVVVQRAVRIDVADVVGVRRIRRIKMYPERFSSSRFVPLLPRGRHVLHFKRKF